MDEVLQLTSGKVELLPTCHVSILKNMLPLIFLAGQLFPLIYTFLLILHVFADEFLIKGKVRVELTPLRRMRAYILGFPAILAKVSFMVCLG